MPHRTSARLLNKRTNLVHTAVSALCMRFLFSSSANPFARFFIFFIISYLLRGPPQRSYSLWQWAHLSPLILHAGRSVDLPDAEEDLTYVEVSPLFWVPHGLLMRD